MPIIAKDSRKEFQAPPEGLYQAVCVDVVDLGEEQTPWGSKQKIRIHWMLGTVDEATGETRVMMNDEGYPFQVAAKYTNSMNEKANLRKAIETWRGRAFTPEEQKKLIDEGFDVEKLIGANCQLQIVHNVADDGRTFANVQAIVMLDKRLPKLAVPSSYVRHQDRKKNGNGGGGGVDGGVDDDIPF